jgi:hypothetical protein
MQADMHVHPLIACRMDGSVKMADAGKITNDPMFSTSNWVIAFCYGERWCSLQRRDNFHRFLNSDVAKPVRRQYLHSIAVPEYLDAFCEDLETYQERMLEDTKTYTLALAHLALQEVDHRINQFSLDGRTSIRQVLMRLSIFYHLMYYNPHMILWAGWIAAKTDQVGYVFVWNRSEMYHMSAQVLHAAMEPIEQYTDQHLWVEWVLPRIATIDDDVSVEIQPARRILFATNRK